MIQHNNDPAIDHVVIPSQLPQLPLYSHYDALYRSLRMTGDSTRMPQAVGVTSSESGEGVSTVAINLAMSAARAVGRTLLVDANLDSPTLAEQLSGVGYATAGIYANPYVGPKFGLDRGYQIMAKAWHAELVAAGQGKYGPPFHASWTPTITEFFRLDPRD